MVILILAARPSGTCVLTFARRRGDQGRSHEQTGGVPCKLRFDQEHGATLRASGY